MVGGQRFWSPAQVRGVVGPVAGGVLLPLDGDLDVDAEQAGQDGSSSSVASWNRAVERAWAGRSPSGRRRAPS